VARSHGLTDEEYAAIRALQEGGVAPAVTNPVWEYLLSVDLVRVDSEVRPRTVRLTPSTPQRLTVADSERALCLVAEKEAVAGALAGAR
jgi:hypothetical protein